MIKFKVKKKNVPVNSIKYLGINIINNAVETLAEMLNKKYSNHECPNHPKHESIVTFVVKEKTYDTIKSNFCCKEFEDSIIIKSDT